MIICIDFDGTICQGQFPSIDNQQPCAKETINRLYDNGHYLIIWTCRTGESLTNAINWLLEQGIKFHRVNDHNPENLRKYGGIGGKKVYAHCYIDDKNLGGFPGWIVAEQEITRMENEYKEKVKCYECK